MPATTTTKEEILELLARRGFVLPSSEVYGGLGGFYDFGPVGSITKRKLVDAWRNWAVKREGFSEIDGSAVVRREVVEASGHLKSFVDPVVRCEKCGDAFRADHLIEEKLSEKAEGKSNEEIQKMLSEKKVNCPTCGTRLPAAVNSFQMMFGISVGAGKKAIEAYLRPETAQSIFIDFPRVFKITREKLPLGIAQAGKAFRNEISPRQGLIRMREFEQLEIEIFLDPEKLEEGMSDWDALRGTVVEFVKEGETLKAPVEELFSSGKIPVKQLAYWVAKEQVFYSEILGIPKEKIRFKFLPKGETPFYSKGNIDMEVETFYGWKETIGNAYRTDYDLTTHGKHSGKEFAVTLPDGRKIIPHVVEPSWGLQRMFYCALESAYRAKGFDRDWVWLDLPAEIAPYVVHVFPLMKRDGLDALAKKIAADLQKGGFDCLYDETGSIGKRYARADEIGCPFSVTIDYESIEKEKGDVTVRDRNTMKQVRVKIAELPVFIAKQLSVLLKKEGRE
ncbi:MAG: glycine--tRNA ligase [archaeon]